MKQNDLLMLALIAGGAYYLSTRKNGGSGDGGGTGGGGGIVGGGLDLSNLSSIIQSLRDQLGGLTTLQLPTSPTPPDLSPLLDQLRTLQDKIGSQGTANVFQPWKMAGPQTLMIENDIVKRLREYGAGGLAQAEKSYVSGYELVKKQLTNPPRPDLAQKATLQYTASWGSWTALGLPIVPAIKAYSNYAGQAVGQAMAKALTPQAIFSSVSSAALSLPSKVAQAWSTSAPYRWYVPYSQPQGALMSYATEANYKRNQEWRKKLACNPAIMSCL